MTTSLNLILCPLFWNKMPPLGLAVLYSYLKNIKDIDINLYDLNIDFYHKVKKDIKEKWISSNPNSEENSKIKKVLSAIIKAGEILIFTYYFKHLVDSKFVHYKPYLHFFQIAVRFYNDFEQK